MADRLLNPTGHGPTQARPPIHAPAKAFTVTKLGQVVPNAPLQAATPLAFKPGYENQVTVKHSNGHQQPARATLVMEDKENLTGKIALQQQRPSFGKTQPIHTGSMAKHLNKQSFGNTVIAPAPTKTPSKASTQLPPNATREPTHVSTAGVSVPTDRRDYKSKSRQEFIQEVKKVLPTYTFYFDSVDASTQALLAKHLEQLQAKITMFYSKTVTHVITIHHIPDKDTMELIRENAVVQNQSTETPANVPSSIPKIPPAPMPQPDRKNLDNTIVYKAIKFGSKVWSVEKLCNLLTPLVGEIRVKKNENKDLRGMLLQEQVFGLGATQTDDSPKSDFHVFKDLYVLVEDTTGRYQTIMAREFPSAPGVEPEYPRFYMESTSRTPYVSVERKRGHVQNIAITEKKELTADGKVGVQTPTPLLSKVDAKRAQHVLASGIINSVTSNIATTTSASPQSGIVSNTQDRAVEQLGKRVLQSTLAEAGITTSSKNTPFVHPGLVDRNVSLLNPDASRAKATLSMSQPSRASVGLERPHTPTPRTPLLCPPLTPAMKMATAQQPTPPRPPTPNAMQPPRPPTPVVPKAGGTLRPGVPEVPGLNEPWDPRKHGYCENCRVGYASLEDHIQTKLHMKYSKDERRFSHLDLLLSKVQRKPKPVAPSIQVVSIVESELMEREISTIESEPTEQEMWTVPSEPMEQDPLPSEHVAVQKVDVESVESALQDVAVSTAPPQETSTASPKQDHVEEPTLQVPDQSLEIQEVITQNVSSQELAEQEPAPIMETVMESAMEPSVMESPVVEPMEQSMPRRFKVDIDELSSELSQLEVTCAGEEDEIVDIDDSLEQTVEIPADETIESTTVANVSVPVQDEAEEERPIEFTEKDQPDSLLKIPGDEPVNKIPSVSSIEAPFDSPEGIVGVELPPLPDFDQDVPYLPVAPVEPSRAVTPPMARFPRTPKILAQENATSQLETDATQPDDKFLDDPSEALATEATVPASPSTSQNEDPVEQPAILRTPRRRRELHSSDPDQSGPEDIVSMVRSPCAYRTRSARLRERFGFGSSSVLLTKETTPTPDHEEQHHKGTIEREYSPILITHGKRKLESVFAKQLLADNANHIPPPSTTMSAIPDMAPSSQPHQPYNSLPDTPTHLTSHPSSFQFQAWPQLAPYNAYPHQLQDYPSTPSPHVPQPSLRNTHTTPFPSQFEVDNSNPFLQESGWDNQQYYNNSHTRAFTLSDASYGHSSQERYPTPSQHRPQMHYNPHQYQGHQSQHVPYHRAVPQVHHHLGGDDVTLSSNDLAVHANQGAYDGHSKGMTDYAPTSATSPMTHFAHSPGTGSRTYDPTSSSPLRSPSVRRVQTVMSFAEQEQERCYYHYLGNRLPEPAGQKKMRTSPSLVDDDDAAEYGEDCVMYLE
ncbi:hypothetical protein BGZ59_006728 [Podila verticillata]|nr:hypothetical protein BGZ59_006728 [Podila verticillata]KFH66223.1 hypothetical protein MVEG_08323 [Podila verticillata NRRL 6337]